MKQRKREDESAIPGKRKPVVEHVPEIKPEDVVWDKAPLNYMVSGEPREFFTISALAMALDKSAVTIRSWENKGYLPNSPYRSPKPKRETIPGVPPKGRRLWTREQIEGILDIAKDHEVILNGKPPNKRFAAAVHQLFTQLLEKDKAPS